jgi:hypothetical protein
LAAAVNYEKLKGNEGALVRIMPPACHLNSDGEVENWPNEMWRITAVDDSTVTLRSEAGHEITLNSDHVRGYTSGSKPYLTLLVQVFIQGQELNALPGPFPGAAVLPRVDRARKARAFFAPALQRAMARQVAVLDRAMTNASVTSHGKPSCTGDTWQSLMPHATDRLSDTVMFHDLHLGDAQLVAEFKAAVDETTAVLESWIATGVVLTDYNAWNVLMHKVEHSLRIGLSTIARFCPDVQYDATMPASGSMLSRVERALAQAHGQRAAWIARHSAGQSKTLPKGGQ